MNRMAKRRPFQLSEEELLSRLRLFPEMMYSDKGFKGISGVYKRFRIAQRP